MNVWALTPILLSIAAYLSHYWIISQLARKRSRTSIHSSKKPTKWQPPCTTQYIRLCGAFSAIATLALPYTFADDPILQPALRCVCFFYACKILDLSFDKAANPPTLLMDESNEDGKRLPAPTDSDADLKTYCWRLITEMRYQSFDIAIPQKDRPSAEKDPLSDAWVWLPPILILLSTYLYPVAETKCLTVLLAIQLGLESLHKTFHYNRSSCKEPQFYKPFAAASFSSFWTTHWHAAAAPFLQSLAYKPGKRYVGRWFGVLATFNLTGIWHAWASAPLVEADRAMELAFKVWAMFMIMGLGILVERVVWGKNQGGMVQRVVVWAVAISSAGWAFRVLDCHSRIGFLRSAACKR